MKEVYGKVKNSREIKRQRGRRNIGERKKFFFFFLIEQEDEKFKYSILKIT